MSEEPLSPRTIKHAQDIDFRRKIMKQMSNQEPNKGIECKCGDSKGIPSDGSGHTATGFCLCKCHIPVSSEVPSWEERFDENWWQIEKPDTLSKYTNQERRDIKLFIHEVEAAAEQRGRKDTVRIIVDKLFNMNRVKDPICKSGYDDAKREIMDFIGDVYKESLSDLT